MNVASIGAYQPGPYESSYDASKAFVYQCSRAIRYEGKNKGVSVSVLCPGPTSTSFFEKEGVSTPTGGMTPEQCAHIAYKQLMANKEVVLPGFLNHVRVSLPTKLKMDYIAKEKKDDK